MSWLATAFWLRQTGHAAVRACWAGLARTCPGYICVCSLHKDREVVNALHQGTGDYWKVLLKEQSHKGFLPLDMGEAGNFQPSRNALLDKAGLQPGLSHCRMYPPDSPYKQTAHGPKKGT